MSSQTILIIDDELEIVSLLSRVLRRQGFNVHSAHTLKEGWVSLCDVKPDILFLDVNLPDGNGLKKLADIKKDYPQVKVVMISAFDMEDDRNQARVNGAFTFLSKPFNIRQVSDLVQQFRNPDIN
ncbi:MAG: response regulator [Chitinophagaceae bacterium]|nr:response regulator [Chitinophagaceae bacterium]